jgi:sulfite reductase (NADPH) hemoprotein beta-component
MFQIVTANRLIDGAVVYLTEGSGWSQSIGEGRLAEDKEKAKDLLAGAERAVEQRQVISPYLIEVTADGVAIRPVRYKELIRATGPSVATDLNGRSKQGL